ncbi:MAG: aspartate-semialdehyde dehydrogenase, partial [Myxococcota bacterium]
MSKEYSVAVVGATGLVGREMIEILEERGFPVKAFVPLASSRSAGEHVQFAGKDYV